MNTPIQLGALGAIRLLQVEGTSSSMSLAQSKQNEAWLLNSYNVQSKYPKAKLSSNQIFEF